MALETFKDLQRFSPVEFDHPELIHDRALILLDSMVLQETARRPGLTCHIHCDVRLGDPREHGKGTALDWHMEVNGVVLPVLDQFLIALRYFWSGVGFYPFWPHPGCHTDLRTRTLNGRKALWWKDESGDYRNVEEYFT